MTSLHKAGWDGKVFDLAALANTPQKLLDDAKIITDSHGAAIHFDGENDRAALGRISALEKSDRVAFAVDFTRDGHTMGEERLVWNQMKLGLSVLNDGLQVRVGTAQEGFKTFNTTNLGLNDTDLHRATVMLDAASDHLQVVLDDKVVLDIKNEDFAIVGAGGFEWGWSLGAMNGREFQGDISDFRLGDRFEFLDGYVDASTVA